MAHKDYREKVADEEGLMVPKHPDPHALAAHAKEILEEDEGVKVFNPNADNAFKVATVSNTRAFAMHASAAPSPYAAPRSDP
eukprot:2958794-Prymnesium_polylepis.1